MWTVSTDLYYLFVVCVTCDMVTCVIDILDSVCDNLLFIAPSIVIIVDKPNNPQFPIITCNYNGMGQIYGEQKFLWDIACLQNF